MLVFGWIGIWDPQCCTDAIAVAVVVSFDRSCSFFLVELLGFHSDVLRPGLFARRNTGGGKGEWEKSFLID